MGVSLFAGEAFVMSAVIEPFPRPKVVSTQGADAAMRYVRRAQEAFDLMSMATTELERVTLCDIAEIWLDMAEAALPAIRARTGQAAQARRQSRPARRPTKSG